MTPSDPSPTRALIIAEPWISMILSGRKTWEMRTRGTTIRGTIGLIRKGSGLIVGLAELVDSLPPLDAAGLAASTDRHGIPPKQHVRVLADGWVVPWVLRGATPLASSIPYQHPMGAVTWVTLDRTVAGNLPQTDSLPAASRETSALLRPMSGAPVPPPLPQLPAVAPPPLAGAVGVVRLTGGNIRNGHIYLRTIERLLPPEAIGGANVGAAAPQRLYVTFDPGPAIETDVAQDKMIFRARGPVRAFFAASGAQEGDEVVMTRTAPHALHVSLRPRRGE
jgi:hypothetical protein